MAAYLGYTLRMKTLFRGRPVVVDDTHTRRRRLYLSAACERELGCVSVINRCSVSLVDKAEHRHEYHCLYVVDEEDCGAADVYNGLWRDSALLPAGGGQLAALLVGPSYRHNPR